MKRIRLYGVVLGLLTCAVVARAQEYNITTTVVNVPGAQILVIGINKPVVPYTADNNGTVQQMTLDFANNPNKTVEILVQQCGDKPPIVMVVLPGAQPPPEDPNCPRRKLIALYIPGSGTLLIDLDKGIATFTPTPAPGAGPREGPSPFTFEGDFLGGLTHAGDLSNASAIEGGVTMYFGPAGLGLGIVRSGDATVQQTTAATTGSSLPPGNTTANFHAAEFKGSVNVLDLGPLSLAAQGGGWAFTARSTTMTTVVVTSPTAGTMTETVTTTASRGGVAPFFGSSVEARFSKYLAALVAIKRGYLRSNSSLDQGVTLVLFGLSLSPQVPRALLHLGTK